MPGRPWGLLLRVCLRHRLRCVPPPASCLQCTTRWGSCTRTSAHATCCCRATAAHTWETLGWGWNWLRVSRAPLSAAPRCMRVGGRAVVEHRRAAACRSFPRCEALAPSDTPLPPLLPTQPSRHAQPPSCCWASAARWRRIPTAWACCWCSSLPGTSSAGAATGTCPPSQTTARRRVDEGRGGVQSASRAGRLLSLPLRTAAAAASVPLHLAQPLPPPRSALQEVADLISQCVQADPATRPTAMQALQQLRAAAERSLGPGAIS